jgi:PEGA domain
MGAVPKYVIALTAALTLASAATANAQARRGAVVVVPRAEIVRPFFYDPFWGPWPLYGYGYPYMVRPNTEIRTHVTPKSADVYVDGYYAGQAEDFDGVFKKLHVSPGGHAVTLYEPGFRTTTQEVYVRPDSTFKMNVTMEPLSNGEVSAPVPVPARPSRRG